MESLFSHQEVPFVPCTNTDYYISNQPVYRIQAFTSLGLELFRKQHKTRNVQLPFVVPEADTQHMLNK